WLHPARAIGDHAFGRRGATHEARSRAFAAPDRPHALQPRRADHGAALRRREEAARRAEPSRLFGQYSARDRAPPRCDKTGRLDHRPRSGGRRGRGTRRRAGLARTSGAHQEILYRPDSRPRVRGSKGRREREPRATTMTTDDNNPLPPEPPEPLEPMPQSLEPASPEGVPAA